MFDFLNERQLNAMWKQLEDHYGSLVVVYVDHMPHINRHPLMPPELVVYPTQEAAKLVTESSPLFMKMGQVDYRCFTIEDLQVLISGIARTLQTDIALRLIEAKRG